MKERHVVRVEDILERIEQLAAGGKYDRAVSILNSSPQDPRLLNAKGVCMLRLGNYPEAVRLFRNLVLTPGCTWTRLDVRPTYRINFATALLLDGHVAGCLEALSEVPDQRDPSVLALRAAVRSWESKLSWWQWLNWRVGRIEPAGAKIELAFPPGSFERMVAEDQPQPTNPTTSPQAA